MTTSHSSPAMPVSQVDRIGLLDALRGFAILGILLMNIPGFGLPTGVGFDPSVWKETGINYQLWYWMSLVPEGTQRALFSMLFGAGIILFTSRAEKKLDGSWPADYFLRRQLWLLLFGLIDIWLLLWYGDILFDYALLGILMFTFRRWSAKLLILGSLVCLVIMVGRETRDLYVDKAIIATGEKIAAIDTTRTKLTEGQKDDLAAMTDFKEKSSHASRLKRTEKAIRKTQGSWGDVYDYRGGIYMDFLIRYLYYSPWDVLTFMFLGMAFFKLGIITGQASIKLYSIMALVGLGVGLTLSYLRLQASIRHGFNWFEITRHEAIDLYTLSRYARSIGLLGLLILLYRSGWFKWLFSLMKPVGQMAFTNYLMQSVLCGLFFYGIGWGMYGKLNRLEVYFVVLAVWGIQIVWSHVWLRYFNFGPFEWLWRSLTYWKKQPMRRKSAIAKMPTGAVG